MLAVSWSFLIRHLNDLSNPLNEGLPLALQDKITFDLTHNEELNYTQKPVGIVLHDAETKIDGLP